MASDRRGSGETRGDLGGHGETWGDRCDRRGSGGFRCNGTSKTAKHVVSSCLLLGSIYSLPTQWLIVKSFMFSKHLKSTC